MLQRHFHSAGSLLLLRIDEYENAALLPVLRLSHLSLGEADRRELFSPFIKARLCNNSAKQSCRLPHNSAQFRQFHFLTCTLILQYKYHYCEVSSMLMDSNVVETSFYDPLPVRFDHLMLTSSSLLLWSDVWSIFKAPLNVGREREREIGYNVCFKANYWSLNQINFNVQTWDPETWLIARGHEALKLHGHDVLVKINPVHHPAGLQVMCLCWRCWHKPNLT